MVSDIHGCHKQFNLLLQKAKYNPKEDKLILLGDYVDRGMKSKEVVEQVKYLVDEWNVVALRGNHEQMMRKALLSDEDELWLMNGGLQTLHSYVGLNWFENGFEWDEYTKAKEFILEYYKHHIDFLQTLKVYHETDNHIFVHAGLDPSYHDDWRNQPTNNFLWIRDVFINNDTNLNKAVVFGHTPTINIQNNEGIYFGKDKIGIDGGCVFGYQMNLLEINEGGYKEYHVFYGEKDSGKSI